VKKLFDYFVIVRLAHHKIRSGIHVSEYRRELCACTSESLCNVTILKLSRRYGRIVFGLRAAMPLKEKMNPQNLNVKQIKAVLRQQLSTTGRKAELILRMQQADPSDVWVQEAMSMDIGNE